MEKVRRINRILKSNPTLEGAGVHLKRAFGYYEVPFWDPFLLLDHFGSKNPDDYLAGFPWHPHRGIETVTYMLSGEVEHGDSIGNKGVIQSGDVQWMTAGSGIIHQEMPHRYQGEMVGFQLWVNLPASHKMMSPRYREIKKQEIPEISITDGIKVKVIAGEINEIRGPVQDLVVETEYLDIILEPQVEFERYIDSENKVFAYVYQGSGYFDETGRQSIDKEHVVLFDDGDLVRIVAKDEPLKLLLISGKPLDEPVAWRGPIVMNTQEELRIAFEEYHNGTFIKSGRNKS